LGVLSSWVLGSVLWVFGWVPMYTYCIFRGTLRCIFGLYWVFFWAPWYTFCVPRGIGVFGFLCMLETLCVILVYLEALGAFFFFYNTLTYQKKYLEALCAVRA
jgi:hypothetical protein